MGSPRGNQYPRFPALWLVGVIFAVLGSLVVARAWADPHPRALAPLWQLSDEIDWLALRETSLGLLVMVQTREPRLIVIEALSRSFHELLELEVDPGSRPIQTGGSPGNLLLVAGRFSVVGARLVWAKQTDQPERHQEFRVEPIAIGDQFDPQRDARGDPEFLNGIVAAAQNPAGILIAGTSRQVICFDAADLSALGGFVATGDVQCIAADGEGWALLTREHGRYGVTFAEVLPQHRAMNHDSCDLDDIAPQWLGIHGGAAICVSPAAIDVIRPGGDWNRFEPKAGDFFVPSATCARADVLGRSLVLVSDSKGETIAIDVGMGRVVWRRGAPRSAARVEMLATDLYVVRILADRAEVIDLLSGTELSFIELPPDEKILATCVDGEWFYAAVRRGDNGLSHGRLRVWQLRDLSPVGEADLGALEPRTTITIQPRVLLCQTERTLTALAIDLP